MYRINYQLSILKKSFYSNDPSKVARELLGKLFIKKGNQGFISGKIVETEAYYGENDPTSRAYKGMNKVSELMYGDVGKLLVYVVHANHLLNIIAHPPNSVGAVLIRAIEPVNGIESMKINRKIDDEFQLCSGPGKLTKAFEINRTYHRLDITKKDSEIVVASKGENNNKEKLEIIESNRIGVKKDLKKKLRFYIKENKFVSKK